MATLPFECGIVVPTTDTWPGAVGAMGAVGAAGAMGEAGARVRQVRELRQVRWNSCESFVMQ